MNIRIQSVKTDTFTMEYFKFGSGKDTLVILPGLSVQSVMGSADAVADAYRLLTDDFTVYVFDRRKDLPPSYTVREMARDTAEALRASGLESVCLFGASQGGMMAMVIAAEHPELVRALALGSASARSSDEQYRVVEEWIRLAKEGNAAGLYTAFGEKLYPPEIFLQSRGLLAEAAKSVTREELERFVILAGGMKDFDASNDLAAIRCPVLVIGSSDDRVLGSDAASRIAEKLRDNPGSELYIYSGCGHAAYDTAPDYKERLLRFFAPASEALNNGASDSLHIHPCPDGKEPGKNES